MSGAYGSSHWLYDAVPFETGQSLKFNDDDSAYLSRTPASASNRKTWTWSSWVKRSNIGINSFIFGCGSSSSNFAFIGFSSDNTIDIRDYQSSYTYSSKTSQVFRDTSAWYHLVLAADMDNSTAADRIKLYVNGERVTSFNSAPSPTTKDLVTNSAIKHVIGSGYYNDGSGVNSYLDGYLFDVHFIDGQALDPTSFIKTENNQLQPKEYFGSYGTNGFRLNFQDDVISEGFNTTVWRGTAADNSISGIGFSPSFVWIKDRTDATAHYLFDVNRGVLKDIYANLTNAEYSAAETLKSFDSDGFTLGNNTGVNGSADDMVAWCWEGGGTPTATNSAGAGATPTAGSVKIDGSNLGSALAGSIAAEKLTANTTKGFSTGIFTKGSGTETVAHGLGAALDWLIVKRYTGGTGSWFVYHSANTANPETDYLRLNSKDDTADDATVWGDTAPTSTVFSVGSAFNSGEKLLFYAWTEISSYSKFGSYEGNANTTGPSVTLGFEPAFVLIKGIDANSRGWYLKDNTRNPFNPRDLFLDSSDSDAEGGSQNITFSSTGFQITNSDAGTNGNGETFIYMAFADTREAAFFKDVSGNNNNFAPNNLDYRDSMIDTPLTNFCTFNPISDDNQVANTFSEGNLGVKPPSTGGFESAVPTYTLPRTGKWYWEYRTGAGGSSIYGRPSIITVDEFYTQTNDRDEITGGSAATNPNGVLFTANDGGKRINNSDTSFGNAVAAGDIIGLAYDAGTGQLFIYINNTIQGSGAAINESIKGNFAGKDVFIMHERYNGNGVDMYNFGQDSSFSGAKIPQGNGADGEDFYYTPPTGYKSLQLSNLPTPAIADPTAHFDTVLWTGNGASSRAISSLSFGPSFVWAKQRSQAISHVLYDSVRGAGNNKSISSDGNAAEGAGNQNQYGYLSSFDSNGFTASDGTGSPNYYFNENGQSFVAWNWIAGGATPSQTYVVKVVSDGGNKYRFDDFGTSAITLDLQEGGTYTFDQSDSSNSGHPFRFSTTANGTHGGGSEYTVGVTTNGTAGSAGAYTRITVAASAPTLYYYCTVHSGMGGQANTNSTHGSTNLKGTIQSTVSANTTAGFSIVSYTGTGSVGTIGHGFSGAAPEMILLKARGATQNWRVYHASLGSDKRLMLDRTNASENAAFLNDTDPTSTVFTIGSSDDAWNLNGATYISYLFHSVESFSKVGSYVGNGNADGPFIFTNFQVSWLMIKASSTTGNWFIVDTVRDPFNPTDGRLYPNVANAESDATALDSVSNGFKVRNSWSDMNTSGQTYVYLAFASAPFKTTSAR